MKRHLFTVLLSFALLIPGGRPALADLPCLPPSNDGNPEFLLHVETLLQENIYSSNQGPRLETGFQVQLGLKASLVQGNGPQNKEHFVQAHVHMIGANGEVLMVSENVEGAFTSDLPLLFGGDTEPGEDFVLLDLSLLAAGQLPAEGDYTYQLHACYRTKATAKSGKVSEVVKDVLDESLGSVVVVWPLPEIVISGVSPNQFSNQPLSPEVTVTSVNARTTTITLDGLPFISGASVDIEGVHSLDVLVDTFDDRQVTAQVFFTLDFTAPNITVSGVESGGEYHNPVSPSVAVEDQNLANFSITLDGQPFTSGSTVETEGAHTLQVQASDLAGNSASQSLTFSIASADNVAPVITLNSPVEGTQLSEREVTISGSVTDDSSVTAQANGASLALDSNGQFERQLILAEGNSTVTITAVDALGNQNTLSRSVLVDAAAPVLLQLSPEQGDVFISGEVLVQGTFYDLNPVTVLVNGSPAEVTGNSFTLVLTFPEGEHSLQVLLTDSGGRNVREDRAILVDLTDPVITVLDPLPGSRLQNGAVTMSGLIQDASPATVTIQGRTVSSEGGLFQVPDILLAPGPNTIELTAEDLAGRQSTLTVEYHLDTGAPSIVLDAPYEGERFGTASINFAGTVNDDLPGVRFLINGNTKTLELDGSFQVPITLHTGSNVITLRAEDDLGQTTELTRTVFLDDQGPQILASSPRDGDLIAGSLVDLIIRVKDDSSVTAALNGQEIAANENTFELSGVTLLEGDNPFTWLVTDQYGHQTQRTLNLVSDQTAPMVEAISPQPDLRLTAAQPDLSVTFSEAVRQGNLSAMMQVLADGVPVTGGLTAPDKASLVFTPTEPWPQGASIEVVLDQVVDLAGLAMAAPASFTFHSADETPPSQPVLSGCLTRVHSTILSITVTGEPGNRVEISGGAAPVSGDLSETGEATFDVALSLNRQNTLNFTQRDPGGNVSLPTRCSIFQDSTNPQVEEAVLENGRIQILFSEPMDSPFNSASVSLLSEGNPLVFQGVLTTPVLLTMTSSESLGQVPVELTINGGLTDLAGNGLTEFQTIFKPQSGTALVVGRVEDAQSGSPMTGVNVSWLGGGQQSRTNLDGDFFLGVEGPDGWLEFSFPGYLSVQRLFVLNSESPNLAGVASPHLTPLNSAQPGPGQAGGVTVTQGLQWVADPGLLQDGDLVALTAVNPQGLPALPPLGWSVLGGAHLEAAGLSDTAPSRVVFDLQGKSFALGDVAWLVRFDPVSHGWIAQDTQPLAQQPLNAQLSLEGQGTFALMVPDQSPEAPPAPQVGSALQPAPMNGTFDFTAELTFTPEGIFPNQRSLVQGILLSSQDLPSGLVLSARLNEFATLLDGTETAAGERVIEILVSRAGNPEGSFEFVLAPHWARRLGALRGGFVDVTIEDQLPPNLNVLDEAGGSVTSGAAELTLPSGALNGSTPVAIEVLDSASMPLASPTGFRLAGAVRVFLGGARLAQPGSLSLTPDPAETETENWVLARLDGGRWLYAGMVQLNAGTLSTLDQGIQKVPASLVDRGGVYAFLQADGPLAYLRGLVSFGPNPVADGRIQDAGHGLAARTDLDGTYGTVRFTNPGGLSVGSLAYAQTGAALYASASAGSVTNLDLNLLAIGPKVISMSPAVGSQGVSVITVLQVVFDQPINRDTLDAGSLLLRMGGLPLARSFGLSQDGRSLTITPGAPLFGDADITLELTSDVQNQNGVALEQPFAGTFHTEDNVPPGPPNVSQVRARYDGDLSGTPGRLIIWGLPSAAGRDTSVNAVNDSLAPFVVHSATSRADGSFGLDTDAAGSLAFDYIPGNRLQLFLLDSAGNRTDFDLPNIFTADGFTLVLGQALDLTTAAGLTLEIPAAAFDRPALVRLTDGNLATDIQVPFTPMETPFHAFNFDLMGPAPTAKLGLSMPVPTGLPVSDGDLIAFSSDAYLFNRPGHLVQDYGQVDNGLIRSSLYLSPSLTNNTQSTASTNNSLSSKTSALKGTDTLSFTDSSGQATSAARDCTRGMNQSGTVAVSYFNQDMGLINLTIGDPSYALASTAWIDAYTHMYAGNTDGNGGCITVLAPADDSTNIQFVDSNTGLEISNLEFDGPSAGQQFDYSVNDLHEDETPPIVVSTNYSLLQHFYAAPGTQNWQGVEIEVGFDQNNQAANIQITIPANQYPSGTIVQLARETDGISYPESESFSWAEVRKDTITVLNRPDGEPFAYYRVELVPPISTLQPQIDFTFSEAIEYGLATGEGCHTNAPEQLKDISVFSLQEMIWLENEQERKIFLRANQTAPRQFEVNFGSRIENEAPSMVPLENDQVYVLKISNQLVGDCSRNTAFGAEGHSFAFKIQTESPSQLNHQQAFSVARKGNFLFVPTKDEITEAYKMDIFNIGIPGEIQEYAPFSFNNSASPRDRLIRGVSDVEGDPRGLVIVGDGVNRQGFVAYLDTTRLGDRPLVGGGAGHLDVCHDTLTYVDQEFVTVHLSADSSNYPQLVKGQPKIVKAYGDGVGNGKIFVGSTGAGFQVLGYSGLTRTDTEGEDIPLECYPDKTGSITKQAQAASSVLLRQVNDMVLYQRIKPGTISTMERIPIVLSRQVGVLAFDPEVRENNRFTQDPQTDIAQSFIPNPKRLGYLPDSKGWFDAVWGNSGAPANVQRPNKFTWGGMDITYGYFEKDSEEGGETFDLLLVGQNPGAPFAFGGVGIYALKNQFNGDIRIIPVGRIPLGENVKPTGIALDPEGQFIYVTTHSTIYQIAKANLLGMPADPYGFDPLSEGMVDEDGNGQDDRITAVVPWSGAASEAPLFIPEIGSLLLPGQQGLGLIKLTLPEIIAGVPEFDEPAYPDKLTSFDRRHNVPVAKIEKDGTGADKEVAENIRVLARLSGALGPEIWVRARAVDESHERALWDAAISSTTSETTVPIHERLIRLKRQSDDPTQDDFNLYLADGPLHLFGRPDKLMTVIHGDLTLLDDSLRGAAQEDTPYRMLSGSRIILELEESQLDQLIPGEAQRTWNDAFDAIRLKELRTTLTSNAALPSESENLDPRVNPASTGGRLASGEAYLQSGEFRFGEVDFALPGRVLDFALARTHRSQWLGGGMLGPGWMLNIEERIYEHENGDVSLVDGSGQVIRYTGCSGGFSSGGEQIITHYLAPKGVFNKAFRSGNEGIFTILSAGGFQKTFFPEGRLRSWEDSSGNMVRFIYDLEGTLRTILDSMGRGLYLEYETIDIPCTTRRGGVQGVDACEARRLSRFVFGEDLYVVTYQYDSNGVLEKVSKPGIDRLGSDTPITWSYHYQAPTEGDNRSLSHPVVRIESPPLTDGSVLGIENNFDAEGLWLGQTAPDFFVNLESGYGDSSRVLNNGGNQTITHTLGVDGHSDSVSFAVPGTSDTRTNNYIYDEEGRVTQKSITASTGGTFLQTWKHIQLFRTCDELRNLENASSPEEQRSFFHATYEIYDGSPPKGDGTNHIKQFLFHNSVGLTKSMLIPGYQSMEYFLGNERNPYLVTTFAMNKITGVTDSFEVSRGGESHLVDLHEKTRREETRVEYDDFGRPKDVWDPMGNKSSSLYGAADQLPGYVQDEVGKGKPHTGYLNGTNILAAEGMPRVPSSDYQYNPLGLITEVHSGSILTTHNIYDAAGRRLATIDDPEGKPVITEFTLDPLGRVRESKQSWSSEGTQQSLRFLSDLHPLGYANSESLFSNGAQEWQQVHQYLNNGLLKRTESTFRDVASPELTSYTHLDPWLLATRVDQSSSGTSISETFDYNVKGALKSHTNTLGVTTHYALYGAGQTPGRESVDGVYVLNRTLGAKDRVERENLFAGDGTTLVQSTHYEYGNHNRLIGVRYADAQGDLAWEAYEYGALGRVKTTFEGALRESLDQPDQWVEYRSSTQERDVLGRPVSFTGRDRSSGSFAYNANGFLVSSTVTTASENPVVTKYQGFDNRGNPGVIFDSLGRKTEQTYDALGRAFSSKVYGRENTTQFDPLGRIVRTQGEGQNLQSSFNGRGDLLTLNQNSQTTRYSYDGLGRPQTVTYPGGRTVTMAYQNESNRMQGIVDSGGLTVQELTYDAMGRINGQTLASATNPVNQVYEYTFDASGNLARIKNNEYQLIRSYGAFGFMEREVVQDLRESTNYSYTRRREGLGRLAETTLPWGRKARYGYHSGGSLASLELDRPEGKRSFEYQLDSKVDALSGIHFGIQTVGTAEQPLFSWGADLRDGAGRVTHASFRSLNVAGEEERSFNVFDELQSHTDAFSHISQNYTYNDLGWLTAAYPGRSAGGTPTAHPTDVHGNRLRALDATQCLDEATLTHDPLSNQITSLGTAPVGYDGLGNQTDLARWDLTFDGENRLVSAVDANGSRRLSFRYDPLGRLQHRQLQQRDPSSSQWYFSSGQDIRWNGDQEVARVAVDAAGTPLADKRGSYLLWALPGMDQPVALERWDVPGSIGSATVHYLTQDFLGNINALVDDQGEVVERYSYDPWGTPSVESCGDYVSWQKVYFPGGDTLILYADGSLAQQTAAIVVRDSQGNDLVSFSQVDGASGRVLLTLNRPLQAEEVVSFTVPEMVDGCQRPLGGTLSGLAQVPEAHGVVRSIDNHLVITSVRVSGDQVLLTASGPLLTDLSTLNLSLTDSSGVGMLVDPQVVEDTLYLTRVGGFDGANVHIRLTGGLYGRAPPSGSSPEIETFEEMMCLGSADTTDALHTVYSRGVNKKDHSDLNPILFKARPFDHDLGLYYIRARWYSPHLGRWLSEDPQGYVDGENLYAAFRNDPVNLDDPTGEIVPFVVMGGIIIAEEIAARMAPNSFLGEAAPSFLLAGGITGTDPNSGNQLTGLGRALNVTAGITQIAGLGAAGAQPLLQGSRFAPLATGLGRFERGADLVEAGLLSANGNPMGLLFGGMGVRNSLRQKLSQFKQNQIAGDYGERLAKNHARDILGETVIESQYKVGAANRGFDFLSFSGRGREAKLFINEVKYYQGNVGAKKFTTFGLGDSGIDTYHKALRKAREAIENTGLDVVTRRTLLRQLRKGAPIRIITRDTSKISPRTLRRIGVTTERLVGIGFTF